MKQKITQHVFNYLQIAFIYNCECAWLEKHPWKWNEMEEN